MSSILRSSKFVRYFAGLARNIVISNRQEIDGSLIQRSQHLSGLISRHFSNSSSLQSSSPLDQTIRRLDEDARRTGRISMKEVEEALNEIRNLKNASTSQSLMVIRCCGNLVPEETPEHRTKLVEEIWNTLEKLGVALDVSHYNALLKVYLENEHKFSPTDFLAKLEKNGVEPNRVTYQRLIAGYCQLGDISGATKILEFMKDKQLPVNEGIFNALILGHSQADDMESAEGMINVMKQANLEPTNETYCTLLSGYARRGDKAAIDRLITDCKVKDILLSDRDFLEVAYAAAINGHDEIVDEVLKNIKNMLAYNQDAANILLRLLTKGKDEAAFKVFQTMQTPVKPSEDSLNMSGHIIIKQFVKLNRPVDQIISVCERLKNNGHTSHGLYIAIEASFYHHNVDLTLDLLRAFKAQNNPIRPHYFYPSIITLGNARNFDGLVSLLKTMIGEFQCAPNIDMVKDYYLPLVDTSRPEQTLNTLLECGISKRTCVVAFVHYLLGQHNLKQALSIASKYPVTNLKTVSTNRQLLDCLSSSGDVKSAVGLVHIMVDNILSDPREKDKQGEEDESISVEDLSGRFLIGVSNNSQTKRFTVDVMKEMVSRGLRISSSFAAIVENNLQGSMMTTEASELLAKLSSGDLTPELMQRPSPQNVTSGQGNIVVLERIRDKLKVENAPQEKLIGVTRSLFYQYCYKGDLENALKTKKEWTEDLKQEMTPGLWACLLETHSMNGDLEGAKECFKNIGDVEISPIKIMRLAKLYIENNLYEDAVALLKNIKSQEDKTFLTRNASFIVLQTAAETTKDPQKVKGLLDLFVAKNLCEVNNVYLGPLIKAHLERDDLEGALKEFEHCVETYRATPWKNELSIRLIGKEDPISLQRLVDLSTKVHGEINSLYDLVFSFIECGRVKQARKILETPGLRGKYNRISNVCERYVVEGEAAPLEGLVEATKDLNFIDRGQIYKSLLNIYCKQDNVDKALGLWTQMQDEDVSFSDEFLIKLGTFLKAKGLHVPFAIPKQGEKPKEAVGTSEKAPTSTVSPLFAALKNKNLDKAMAIKQKIDTDGGQLTKFEISRLVELLAEKNRLQEATTLLTTVPADNLPSISVVKYFTNCLAKAGEYELFKQLDSHLPENVKKATSFINKFVASAVTAGKVKDELDNLESEIDKATTPEEIDEVGLKFPRGGIFAVLESSPSSLEQVTRIVEKYNSKGVKTPANCLAIYYLINGQNDKAKEIYDKYNVGNSSRIMFKPVLKKARQANTEQPIEDLLSLTKDAPSITPQALGIIYSNMINICVMNNNAEKGLAKLEEAVQTVPLDMFHISCLRNLKKELEKKNIPFKYTIPERRAKEESSSSSSSSDAEPRQSMVAKH